MIGNSLKLNSFFSEENKEKMRQAIKEAEDNLNDGFKVLDPEATGLLKEDLSNLRVLLDLQKIGIEENNPAMGLAGHIGYELYMLILSVDVMLNGLGSVSNDNKRRLTNVSTDTLTNMMRKLTQWRDVIKDILEQSVKY